MKQLYILLFLSVFVSSEIMVAQTPVSILEARENNPDGSAALEGQIVQVSGIAVGPNFRPAGLTFVLHDSTDNVGITIFALDDPLGYTVTDGDELTVTGEISPFNGLNEIIPTEITINSQGNPIPTPTVVTNLDESTESNLVRIENVMLVDPTQWELNGSFNVDLTDGVNTYQMRIDSDIDISGMEAPVGTFNVTGIGGQFDNEAPFDSGYQLFPRGASDINPYNTEEITYDQLSIAEARQIDADGNLVKDGDRAELNGIVHGINLRPSGLQFFVIDATNTGIAVFSFSDNFGYSVAEGDEVTILGELSQFNGLAQIEPDTVFLESTGNDLVSALPVTSLGEFTESSLVTINAINYVDMTEWVGDGSSFNVDFETVDGDTLRVRIDDDTELSNMPPAGLPAFITGIGSQFDSSEPYDGGYQILPRYLIDIQTYLSTNNLYEGDIKIYPNPSPDFVNIEADDNIERIQLISLDGSVVKSITNQSKVNLSDLAIGQYILLVEFEDTFWVEQIGVTR